MANNKSTSGLEKTAAAAAGAPTAQASGPSEFEPPKGAGMPPAELTPEQIAEAEKAAAEAEAKAAEEARVAAEAKAKAEAEAEANAAKVYPREIYLTETIGWYDNGALRQFHAGTMVKHPHDVKAIVDRGGEYREIV